MTQNRSQRNAPSTTLDYPFDLRLPTDLDKEATLKSFAPFRSIRIFPRAASVIVAALIPLSLFSSEALPYQNRTLPVEKRVDDLLGRLTLEEKIELCGGVNTWFIRGNERLGLPRVAMADGSTTGVKGSFGTGTVLPSAMALAATWDRSLARGFADVEANDCLAAGYQILLGPAVNLSRNPLLGRNTEYFGEDPFLSGAMGVEIIRTVQKQGVMACVKHFVANDIDLPRTFSDSRLDERTLREIYLKPFEMAVKEAQVGAVMGCYNHVNGIHGCVNPHTGYEILRKEWGFDGIFLSDWGAGTGAAVAWANGPLDLAMPTGPMADPKVVLPLIKIGKIDAAIYDTKVRHILRTNFAFGFYDRPAKDEGRKFANQQGAATALDVARAGIVLLKNEQSLLPFDHKIRTLAVLGPHSQPVRPGVPYVTGPSGSSALDATHPVTLLQGITAAADKGVNIIQVPDPVELFYETKAYEHKDNDGIVKSGLRAEYYTNDSWSGEPSLVRIDQDLSFGHGWRYKNWLKEIRPFTKLSVRWTGQIRVPTSGDFTFLKKSSLGTTVWLGDEKIIDDMAEFNKDHWIVPTRAITRKLEGDTVLPIKIEYRIDPKVWHMFGFQFGWGKLDFSESVAAAKSADAVVLCMGYEYMSEGEGFERTFSLPYGQSELIQAVAAANPRTVVMTTGGGAYQTAEWLPKVPALMHLWYLGQNGGTAAGELLFGKVNPSGKLPATFDARWEDNPSSSYFKADWSRPSPYPVEYTEGLLMGYRGYDATGRTPLFPFGHGLSYTMFGYSDLALTRTKEGDFQVSVKIRNTGNRPGAEIVQLYVGQQNPAVQRPVRELKGFDRTQLQPGNQTEVTFNVRLQDLKVFDPVTRSWTLPPGKYEFSVGASSRDLRLKSIVPVP